MAGDFDAQGSISLKVSGFDDIDAIVTALGRFNEETGASNKTAVEFERSLVDFERASRSAANGINGLTSGLASNGKFDKMKSEVDDLTKSLRELAQAHVAEGGRSPLAAAAQSVTVDKAREVIAVTKASGLTAQQVAQQVVAAEKQKQDAIQRTNAAMAQGYQRGSTDSKSFLGQANSREASAGLRAADTSWAQEARALQSLNQQYDSHIRAFDRVMAEKSRASQQNSLYNQYLWEQERAQRKATQAANDHTAALPRLRYALYDVATTTGIMSSAITAGGAAALTASASYESSFTNVERTLVDSGAATQALRDDLIDLTHSIPQSWGFITDLAMTGSQLGVAEKDLASFTETTTKFATVTGIAAEESATAFGSLGELLNLNATQYEQLGSAIAYVGVNSVATDKEIITMSQRLAASATNAGMSAQEVIALSGAFASLRIAPERAQGVMEVYFKKLNTALVSGGDELAAFAHYAGLSTEEVQKMAREDPAQYFRSLSAGLGQLDPQSLTLALDDLGLSGIRAGEVFGRVSSNLGVFDRAMVDSNKAWKEGSHLGQQYSLVVDDLASRWQIFLNSLMEAGASIGNALAPIAKWLLDVISPALQAFSKFANSGFGRGFIIASAAVLGLAAAVGAAVSGGALFLASLAAVNVALKELGINSGTGVLGLNALRGGFSAVATTAGMSTGAIKAFKWALASTGIGLAVVAIGTLVAAMGNATSSAEQAEAAFNQVFQNGTGGLSEAIVQDSQAYTAALEAGNKKAADSYIVLGQTGSAAATGVSENNAQLEAAASLLGSTAPAVDGVTSVIDNQTIALGENALAWVRNALANSEAFQELANNADFASAWREQGITLNEVLAAAATNGEQGVLNIFAAMDSAAVNGANVHMSWIQQAFAKIAETWNILVAEYGKGWEALLRGDVAGAIVDPIQNISDRLGRLWSKDLFSDNVTGMAKALTGAANQARVLGNDGLRAGQGLKSGADDGADALDRAGDAADKAAKKVFTLKDYANGLSEVWDRAFEIRFSGQQAMDQVTSAWSKMRKEITDAREALAKYRAEMATLAADKSTLQYWLKVAEDYGDAIRAAELRAKIGENDQKQAELKKKVAEEQSKLNKTLVGNSDAAVRNREALLGLTKGYEDQLKAYADSGMSSEELRRKSEQLKREFIAQAVQLGFSRTEVTKYARAFDDVTFAIRNVPRSLTVAVNANPAITALNEIKAKADLAKKSVDGVGGAFQGAGAKANGARGAGSGAFDAAALSARTAAMRVTALAQVTALYAKMATVGNGFGSAALKAIYAAEILMWRRIGGFKDGGYTGNGGVNEVAGVTHGKEFVFSAPAVANLGLGNLARTHDAAKRGRPAPSLGAASGPAYTELSPYDRQLLVDIKNAVGVDLSGPAMAAFVGATAENNGRTGRP